jgi:hypothetical protein
MFSFKEKQTAAYQRALEDLFQLMDENGNF